MARRKPLEPSENHERWLISYADFITLLFAFFVVMYSTSSLTSGDFRVLSDAIVRAFGLPGVSFIETRPVGDGVRSTLLGVPGEEGAAVRVPLRAAANDRADAATRRAGERADAEGVRDALQSSLGDLVAPDRISAAVDGSFVELSIPANLLYPSGSRALLNDATPMLERLAEVLAALPNEVVVEGHTDDVPIRNGLFDSNWDLSAARAVAVVRRLESEGIAASRLSAVGYGSHRPVADNATEDGRAANRRVVLRIRGAVPVSDNG
jgi:chemotaxis protein MotB